METDFDVCVIGAGVVGLAAGRAAALSGRSVIILEAETDFGTHTSARNSEVIHAGIYYPAGSLKAELCVSGKDALYAYAAAKGVQHSQCGKYIVATAPEQVAQLEGIKARAEAHGVMDLNWGQPDKTPEIVSHAALFSPSSGIVDSHGLMQAMLGDAEEAGAILVCSAKVERITERFVIHTADSAIRVASVINSAGLWAQDVASRIEGLDQATIPPISYARGHYARLSGVTHASFPYLVYPIPVPGGLGTHITIDMGGQVRFGPDVEWIDTIDYDYPPGREQSFYDSIRAYWPGLPEGCLVPDYTGIRPKVAGGDFIVESSVPGLVNLYGIESPGLTASLPLADLALSRLAIDSESYKS